MISRRQFVQTGAGVWTTLFSGALQAAARRPNLLYVFSDMQRANSIGAYGDPNVRTPVLDSFARQGVRLDAAMSNTPVCCPHRACRMTGLYSHHHGVMSNGVSFTRTARGIAEQFREAGYVTHSRALVCPQGSGAWAAVQHRQRSVPDPKPG